MMFRVALSRKRCRATYHGMAPLMFILLPEPPSLNRLYVSACVIGY